MLPTGYTFKPPTCYFHSCIQESQPPAVAEEDHQLHWKLIPGLACKWCPNMLQAWNLWDDRIRPTSAFQDGSDHVGLAKRSWCFRVQKSDPTWDWTWATTQRQFQTAHQGHWEECFKCGLHDPANFCKGSQRKGLVGQPWLAHSWQQCSWKLTNFHRRGHPKFP